MFEALRRHVRLLRAYGTEAFVNGNHDYDGEVAGKLRVLVSPVGRNKPLLLKLMETTGTEVLTQLDGPPMQLAQDGLDRPIRLEEYLHREAIGFSIGGTFREVSHLRLIQSWAEQSGAAHEDWGHEEDLHITMNMQLIIGDMQVARVILQKITSVVLSTAERFLAAADKGADPPKS